MSLVSEPISERPLRMRDLCDLTGLPRQVIHFYIQQGLVPEGRKTGRNTAVYRAEHVERIRLVRRLQHERFLPLKAIKAMIYEQEESFSPAQRRLLGEVKDRLGGALRSRVEPAATVDAAEALAAAGLAPKDLEDLVEVGLLTTQEDVDGRLRIAREDAWLLDTWGELHAAGFTRDLGFSPKDLAIIDEGIGALFRRETELLAQRLVDHPPERVAAMVERSLPIVNAMLARLHDTKARTFFATLVPLDTERNR